jgi:hypothetical protein
MTSFTKAKKASSNSVDDEEDFDLNEMRCLCFSRDAGFTIAASLPAVVILGQILTFLCFTLVNNSMTQSFTAVIVLLGSSSLLDTFLYLVTCAVGFAASGISGPMKKKLLALWIMVALTTAVFAIVLGYEKAYFFASYFKEYKQAAMGKFKTHLQDGLTKFVGRVLMIIRGNIVAGNNGPADAVLYHLLFFPEFSAFIQGVLPGVVIACSGVFVYIMGREYGLDWTPRRTDKNN